MYLKKNTSRHTQTPTSSCSYISGQSHTNRERYSRALATVRVYTLPLALVGVAPEVSPAVVRARLVAAPVRSLPKVFFFGNMNKATKRQNVRTQSERNGKQALIREAFAESARKSLGETTYCYLGIRRRGWGSESSFKSG